MLCCRGPMLSDLTCWVQGGESQREAQTPRPATLVLGLEFSDGSNGSVGRS